MDPKVNGQIQTDWRWLVAGYLFLGGVGAGAYVIAFLNSFAGESAGLATSVGLWISWPAVLIGTLCLMADLGSPLRAILAGIKLGSSWIARGFWIISIFMVLAFVHWYLVHYTDVTSDPGTATGMLVLGTATTVFAVSTMAYTGILLGASKGIPFWRSGIIPVLFVISAVVTGHFSVMVGMFVVNQGASTVGPLQVMAAEAAALVAVEVLAVFFFLQAAFRQPDSRESAERILRLATFIVGYFVLGLAAPLTIMLILFVGPQNPPVDSFFVMSTFGAVLGLLGGLILRYGVLVTGTLPTWNIAGFKFRRIFRPKEPRPDIGMVPPS